MSVPVSRAVADQLETIRQSGVTNMLDRARVQAIANELEMYELVDFCTDRDRYARAIFYGIAVQEGGEPTEAEAQVFRTGDDSEQRDRRYREGR